MATDYESEAQLENNLMRRLNALGYKTVVLNEEIDVVDHFRDILNRRNANRLNGKQISDSEFSRVMHEMTSNKSIYQMAQLLRGSDIQPYGKISIQRDDNSDVYLDFFDGENYQNNTYEVTHQVTVNANYVNRYDVTILINGLPVVAIELKRRGVDFTEAFNQIIRYRDESFRGLFRFIQMFVISNGDSTRYFANSDGPLNSNFMFYWTDKENNWLNDIDAFCSSFFTVERLHSLIAKYTIFDSSNERIIIMRPYQIYATEAILNQALNKPDTNGYIWHTTGSGKTITAFKAAQIMARMKHVDKVIFLIDRADLDTQTAKNFNSYLPKTVTNEPALDRTDDTESLVNQLQASDNPLIVSTIQKMNVAVKNNKYKNLLESYHDKHVVFIEDEAHRSQLGEMRKNINNWFKNSQHFGFTGTPIFPENVGPDGRTTETLYNELLHKYLIKDAIRDHNVLGFNVQYISTIRAKNKQIEDKDVYQIDKPEVFENEERMEMIAKHMLLNHGQVTHDKLYNAIFTVPNTNLALKYYDIFRKLDPKHNLNVYTIFTWKENENDAENKQENKDSSSKHGLDRVIKDYNQQYGTDFSTKKFDDYFSDVSKRMKEYNSQTPSENIDILIVVNMFLTGFDSPKLSTLYIDKNLQWHGLIQAFSRTNRVEKKTKQFGSIIAYRNLKEKTDQAVGLYSAGSAEEFFVPTYSELKGKFENDIASLKQVTPTPKSVDELYNQGDEALKEFVLNFREVLRDFNKIRVYDDFEWDNFEGQFDRQELESFRSKYFDAYRSVVPIGRKPKESILNDIDFDIQLIATDKIDVQYIVNLIKAINLDSAENTKADTTKIKRILGNADNDRLKSKADLLAKFLDEIIPKLKSDANIGSALNQFLADRRQKEIQDFSDQNHISQDLINQQIENYNFYGKTNSRQVNSQLNEQGLSFKKKRETKQKIKTFVLKTIERFTMS